MELKTQDVTEAAYMWCQDNVTFERQESVTRDNGHVTVFFVFSGRTKDKWTDMRKAFYNRTALVEPKFFVQRLNDVRDILNNVLRSKRRK